MPTMMVGRPCVRDLRERIQTRPQSVDKPPACGWLRIVSRETVTHTHHRVLVSVDEAGCAHVSQLRGSELIYAPRATVGAALRHTRTAERGLSELGVSGRSTAASALLVPGDELAFRSRLGRVPVSLTTRVVRADADALTSVAVAGPVAELHHESTLSDDGGGTRITDSVRWTSPAG